MQKTNSLARYLSCLHTLLFCLLGLILLLLQICHTPEPNQVILVQLLQLHFQTLKLLQECWPAHTHT